jgi:hypothetical protein
MPDGRAGELAQGCRCQKPHRPQAQKREGISALRKRKAIVEQVNGHIKEARSLRSFLLRGLEKVDAEWHLIVASHNLLKLIRHRRSEKQC